MSKIIKRGDEARKAAWKTCPKCQLLAKELGGLDEVQCYLIEHAEKFLAEHGRMMVGWDEILRNNLRPTSEGGYRSRQPRVRRGHVSGRNHLFRLVPG